MADKLRTSPAGHLEARFGDAEVTGERGVSVREQAYVTMVGLRVRESSPARSAIEERLEAALPARCGETTASADTTLLWLSPDEFLLVSETVPGPVLVDLLADLVDGSAGAVIDLSTNRTTLVLEGPSVLGVLRKGCPLDLHPRVFEVGSAVVTTLARVPVILRRTGEQTYRLMPRASYADHLGRWLIDAMAEFAVPAPSTAPLAGPS